MTSRISYLGEVTGDNMQVAPGQLLDMVRKDIAEDSVKGLFIIAVREDDTDLLLEYYRCQLPKFVEVAVLARTFWKICADQMNSL